MKQNYIKQPNGYLETIQKGIAAVRTFDLRPSRGIGTREEQIARLKEELETADAVVVGSPVYYGQPNGALLALLQRALFSASSAVAGKPVATVAICRRGGATAAFQCLNLPFQMLSCYVVGSQYWNIAYGREAGEAAKDTEGMQTMRTLARNLAWLLKSAAAGAVPRPAPEPWAPMHFIR